MTVRWHCWTCSVDIETLAEDRPTCCEGAMFSPYDGTTLPREGITPDPRGDGEDRVLYMMVHHGGSVALRLHGKHLCIVWIPPDGKVYPGQTKPHALEEFFTRFAKAKRAPETLGGVDMDGGFQGTS